MKNQKKKIINKNDLPPSLPTLIDRFKTQKSFNMFFYLKNICDDGSLVPTNNN